MFPLYGNTVNTLRSFIKSLDVNSTKSGLNRTLRNHLEYPSLLSLTDTLASYNIKSTSIKVPNENVLKIPTPFLTFQGKDEPELIAVNNIINDTVCYEFNGRKLKARLNTFLDNWNNVVIISEANQFSNESNYSTNRKTEILNVIKYSILATFTLIFLLFPGGQLILNNDLTTTTILSSTGLLKVGGIIATTLLLIFEIDNANPAIGRICSSIKNANCAAILNSKESKLFGLINWSEIGYLYFCTTFLLLILYGSVSIILLSILSALAFPYVIFSIFYQWKVAKQWCTLCLIVQLILTIEFALVLMRGSLIGIFEQKEYFKSFLDYRTVLSIGIPSIWFLLKPVFVTSQKNKLENVYLRRLKYMPSVFKHLLGFVKKIDDVPPSLGITFGNNKNKLTIIKVCNPYCGPCARAHGKIEEIINQAPNVTIQTIFTSSTDPSDKSALPVKHFLAIAAKGDEILTKKALNDWYSSKEKNYALFSEQYPISDMELSMQDKKVDEMLRWCMKVGINYTPTIFINNALLPDSYDLDDLKYFINAGEIEIN